MNLTFKLDATGWLEVMWMEDDKQLKCVSYHPTQLDLLQTDAEAMGTSLDDYAEMLAEWVASYVPPSPPAPTVADYDAALTDHLDATAQSHKYDNRITCALRAGYEGPFKAEGQAFASWMDQCNWQAYQILEEVKTGKISEPSIDEFLDMLPKMIWPT